jgi:biopolymer transport protein ExbB
MSLGSLLLYMLQSEGYIFGTLLFLEGVALVALIVLLAIKLRRGRAIPTRLLRDVDDLARRRAAGAVVERSQTERSLLGQALHAGAVHLSYGIEEARRSAANVRETLTGSSARLLRYLALIGISSPLLGLAGTIVGVVLGLEAVLEAGDAATPALLVRGLSHSLVVTLHGLLLSLVAVFFYTVFKNRLAGVTTATTSIVDNLLMQLSRVEP